jgi:hypothetical protein
MMRISTGEQEYEYLVMRRRDKMRAAPVQIQDRVPPGEPPERYESPEVERLLECLQDDRHSSVGNSYYYIRAGYGGARLYRMVIGGGRVFFDETVDHHSYSISWEDLDESVNNACEYQDIPGCYHISPLIEKKLRALLDA